MWKIRKRERSITIEVFKTEDIKGYGGILSDEFVEWRASLTQPETLGSDVEMNTMQKDGMHDSAGDVPETKSTNVHME